VFIEGLEIGELPDHLAVAFEHVIFKFVFFVETEPHTDLSAVVQVRYKAGVDAGKFTFGAVVNESAIVGQDIIGRSNPA
jgi:hypothetical protein